MPFVQRENGSIVALFGCIQLGWAEEELPEWNEEVFAFRNPPSPPATSVSARQFKLQLLAAGLLDQVDAWIAGQSRAVQVAFEYSGSFVRDEPMMVSGFTGMGFSVEEIDAFFEAAAKQ
jgi:hypothetical protein